MKVTTDTKTLTLTSDEASQIAKIVKFFKEEFKEYDYPNLAEIMETIVRMNRNMDRYCLLDVFSDIPEIGLPSVEIVITDD